MTGASFGVVGGGGEEEEEEEGSGRSHMRVTVTPKDEERLVGLMARERPRSAVVAAGGDLVTAPGGGGGEGSDGDSSGSIEEISADDFRKDSSSALGGAAAAAAGQRSRSWVGPPAVGYMARNFGHAFNSFAWSQAVRNKPLGLQPPPAPDDDEVEHAVDASDGEKEEGEIEEGEAVEASASPARAQSETIDLDVDASEKAESVAGDGGAGAVPASAAEEEEVNLDQRVGSILEELEMVSIEEAEKYGQMLRVFAEQRLRFGRRLRKPVVTAAMLRRSFEGACGRLHTCFENLKPLFQELENGSPMAILEPLMQQAFIGIDTLTTVRPTPNAGWYSPLM